MDPSFNNSCVSDAGFSQLGFLHILLIDTTDLFALEQMMKTGYCYNKRKEECKGVQKWPSRMYTNSECLASIKIAKLNSVTLKQMFKCCFPHCL